MVGNRPPAPEERSAPKCTTFDSAQARGDQVLVEFRGVFMKYPPQDYPRAHNCACRALTRFGRILKSAAKLGDWHCRRAGQ